MIANQKTTIVLITYGPFRLSASLRTRQSTRVQLRLSVKVVDWRHPRVRFCRASSLTHCQLGCRWAFAFRQPATSGRHVVFRMRLHPGRWMERRGFSPRRRPGASYLRRRTVQPWIHWSSSWRSTTRAERPRTSRS